MSGTPGLGLNNPEGFANFTTPTQPPLTIAVNQSSGNVAIPLAVLPFWRNDGGFRSYGGVRRVSIFDAASVEGTSTPDIPAVTDADISAQGTFQVANPDAQKIYKIVIRVRSAPNDPNFRDFICVFRLVTPLEVPLDYVTFDDVDIPNIEYDGVDFSFDDGTPTAEVRLRDGSGGIQLPTAGGTAFSAPAKAFMLRQLQSLRDGVVMVDFFAGGSVNCTRRQLYHFHWTGSVWLFAKIRSRDFPAFDPYSGSTLGIAQAAIDLDGSDASLTFTYNGYTYGQRFESFIAVGRKGFLNIDPKQVLAGGTVDISSIVDFSIQNVFHRFHLTDQYITLIGTTEEKLVYRQVPLWLKATALVTIDNDSFVPPTTTPIPTDLLRARLVTWPWVEFPNLSHFLNVPTGAVAQNPAGGKYPDLLDINLYDGVNPVPVATWQDEVELWNDMVELQLPNQGLTIPVLDVRALLDPNSPFFRIEAGVRDAGSQPGIAYTYRADFPLNVNGEPVIWTRDDIVPPVILPTFVFAEWGKLKITWPVTASTIAGLSFTGDVGTQSFSAPAGPFPEEVEYDLRVEVMSREASFVMVEFTGDDGVNSNLYRFWVPTIVEHQQLIGVTDINVFFAGNMVLFPTGSLAVVEPGPSGEKTVVLIGDVGQITIYDAQENVPYFTGQLGDGGERIFSNPLHPHVDVDFMDTTPAQSRVRIPNTFYDLREGAHETFAVASRAHGPTAGGLASSAYDFAVPRARVNLGTGEIEFEDDGSGFAWNFMQWQVMVGKTLRRKIFNHGIVVSTPYMISEVLSGVLLNEHLFVVFKHNNGFQRVAAYKISNSFEKAYRVELHGFV